MGWIYLQTSNIAFVKMHFSPGKLVTMFERGGDLVQNYKVRNYKVQNY